MSFYDQEPFTEALACGIRRRSWSTHRTTVSVSGIGGIHRHRHLMVTTWKANETG